MGLFDRFKAKKPGPAKSQPAAAKDKEASKPAAAKAVKPEEKPAVKKEAAPAEIKGKTRLAYRILIKPLITEKATTLGAFNQYVFAVSPQMNKVEIKKAIRTIYQVDPLAVHVMNYSGKSVRTGRISGKMKNWKKAVITLKPGDKIEVYEGV